jgi:hypothetical protein
MTTSQSTIDQPRDVVTGQFGDKPQSTPDIAFTADGITRAQREQRHEALSAEGFIPAVSGAAERSGTTTRRIETWWDSHFVRAEYRPDASGFPQMSDDVTPGMTGGQALSGHRRTHRMKYEGADVTVRMPSAASIKRFAKEQAGTFDVPVTATHPTGDISGWVRVTQNGVNEWSVQGLSFPGGDSAQVAEAVSAVLESRRPSTALRDAGDLLERRRERLAAGGEVLNTPKIDSFVAGAGYDKKTGVLAVKIGEVVYGYKATADRVRAFANSKSIGAAYNRLIKGTKTAQVSECAKCHRFNSAGAKHRCPSKHKAPLATPIAHNIAARAAALNASR